jgi:oligo-1,6-glucosidase
VWRVEPARTAGATGAEPWWRTGTLYQVYPRSFTDSDGDGIGDLRGLIAKADYLQWLGVDAVWLSPVYPSPQRDNGYDISDYEDIDPVFGSLADLDELISELHSRGIRLVMDLVVNHTSDQHPWFVEASSSPASPKRDWYVWRPARPGTQPGAVGAEPTNWESFFSEPAWTFHESTGEYYLHLFAVEQPDLNWENPEVREAVYGMMRRWLDRGVDGFRMDVINLISKRYPLQDGPLLPHGLRGSGREQYTHGPRLEEYLQEMRRQVFDGRAADLVTIGETPDTTMAQARRVSDPSAGMLDMVFQFEHVDLDRDPDDWQSPRPLDRRALYDNLAAWQEAMADTGWNSLYWSNHDQPRTVSRYGDDSPQHRASSAKTLTSVLFLMRGTAVLYQGDEIGMANFPFSSLADFVDVSAVNYIRDELARGAEPDVLLERLRRTARDNARTPVQWTSDPGGGFSTGRPWYPMHPDHVEVSVEAQRDDLGSVLAHVRGVLALRKSADALRHGAFADVATDHPDVVCFERRAPGAVARVVANLSSSTSRSTAGDRPAWSDTDPVLTVGAVTADALGPWASTVWVSGST